MDSEDLYMPRNAMAHFNKYLNLLKAYSKFYLFQ